MRKNNLFPLVILSVLSAQNVNAEFLSPEAAYSRAISSEPGKMVKSPSKIIKSQPVFTVETDGLADIYVFSQSDNGYLIVSADDLAPALLGYADEGSFDKESMPPSLKYWLDSYASQIEWLRNNSTSSTSVKAAARPQRAAISPMVKTRWNQDAPFNDKCPLDNGKRSVTGCVATAMAQVMNYHQWPEKGTGSKSYAWNGETLSLDYSTITYDWSDMADVYSSSSTEAQKEAVATLMYSCGVAVEMDYSSDESGASSFKVARSLIDYFGYDKGVEYMARDYYGLYEWEDIVYNQLKNYGPVQYSGQSNDGGHSFVCDGYSTDGYFHINWGWGGMSDGYFLLTALDPETQGIGGSTSGYNFSQDIIANVKRPDGNDSYSYVMYMTSDFTIRQTTAQLGGTINVVANVYNFSTTNITGEIGVKFTSETDGKAYFSAHVKFTDLAELSGYSGYSAVIPEDLPAGSYKVTPVFKVGDGDWQEIRTPLSAAGYVTATVSGTTVNFTAGQGGSIAVNNVDSQSDFYFGSKFYITATAVNSGSDEYYGTVRGAFINPQTNYIVAVGDEYPLDVLGGDSAEIEYISGWSYPDSTTPSAGTYYFAFVDASSLENETDYDLVSTPISVTVQAAPASTSISVTSLTMPGGTDAVDKSDLKVTATVSCTSGYFANSLTLAIFPYSTASVSSVDMFTSETIFLSAGESKQITVGGNFSSGESGKQYMAAFFNGQSQISNIIVFKLANTAGVEDIVDDMVRQEVYTLSGVKITDTKENSSLSPGIYIVKTTDRNGNVSTNKIIAK